MIRFVTYRNFPLIDLQIEAAYRRRCRATAVTLIEDLEGVRILGSLPEPRRRNQSRDWLRQLVTDMDALSERGANIPATRRRHPSRLVAANESHTGRAGDGKRRQGRARR